MAVLQLFFPFKALSLCCSPSSLSSHNPTPYYSSLMQPSCNPLSLITQSSLLFSASPLQLQESLTRPSRLPDNPVPLLKIPFFPFSRHNMINHSCPQRSTVVGLLRGPSTLTILLRDTQSSGHLPKPSSKLCLSLFTTRLKQLSSNEGLTVCH